jgi:hypothetical protein
MLESIFYVLVTYGDQGSFSCTRIGGSTVPCDGTVSCEDGGLYVCIPASQSSGNSMIVAACDGSAFMANSSSH